MTKARGRIPTQTQVSAGGVVFRVGKGDAAEIALIFAQKALELIAFKSERAVLEKAMGRILKDG